MAVLMGVLVLAASVLPLKPPLSDAARHQPGPTVIRAGELRPTDLRTARQLAHQAEDWRRKMQEEIESTKRQAAEKVARMERMTVSDLLQGRDVLGEMRAAGYSPQRIAEFRRELEKSVAQIRAEGRRMRQELKAAGLEVPSP